MFATFISFGQSPGHLVQECYKEQIILRYINKAFNNVSANWPFSVIIHSQVHSNLKPSWFQIKFKRKPYYW